LDKLGKLQRRLAQAPLQVIEPLNWYGIDLSEMMGTTITPQAAIELGHDICTELHHGNTAAG
jgi:hypothetical protein